MRLAATPLALSGLLVACGATPGPGASAADGAAPADAAAATSDGADREASSGDAGSSDAATSPAGPGPYAVGTSSTKLGDFTVNVFDPSLPPGERAPLVLFKHGFQLRTANYQATLTQIASHGYIVLGVDSQGGLLGGPTQAAERDGVLATLDWAAGQGAPFAAHADAKRVAAAGHSRGGKVAFMAAAKDARIGAVLGLDPVNGCGPGQSYSADCPDVTGAGQAPSLAIPVGLCGETNDTQGFMPCAPANQNFQTVYAAAGQAPWAAEWTFSGAAHMTFTDDGGGSAGLFCAKAPGNETTTRDEIRTLAVAFLDRHLHGDGSRDAWLTGAKVPSDATVQHKP